MMGQHVYNVWVHTLLILQTFVNNVIKSYLVAKIVSTAHYVSHVLLISSSTQQQTSVNLVLILQGACYVRISQHVYCVNKSITWMEVSANYAVHKSKVVSVVSLTQYVFSAKVGMFLIQRVTNVLLTVLKRNRKYKDSN